MRSIHLITLLAFVVASPMHGAAAPALHLDIVPEESSIDRPVVIRVQANAGDTVSLTLTTQRFGLTFAAQAAFVVPPSGMLDTARDAPQSGSYSGVHAMGLFWSALRRIALLGSSKGGELALLSAATFPEVRAVVAIAPASAVFSGIGMGSGPLASSWTYRNAPVPFVNGEMPQEIREAIAAQRRAQQKVSYKSSYLARLQGNTRPAAVIPVERIRGPVLLIAGGDDALWPSEIMARQVKARLVQYGHRYDDQLLIYPEAGHPIGVPFGFAAAALVHTSLLLGGGAAANEGASEDAWPRLIDFLRSVS